MKRKFEDLIYKILSDDRDAADIVKEAISGDGSAYVPSGLSTANNSPTSRPGNPPYSLWSGTGLRSPTQMGQDEEETDAPKLAPFPLEASPDQIMNAYDNLANLFTLIKQTQHSPNITKAQKNKARELTQTIKSVMGNIKKIGNEISKIKI